MARPVVGNPPAVCLWNPKFPHNVGGALRACAAFGLNQLWWTGDRVPLDTKKGQRLPREERMKGYRKVEMVRSDRPFDAFPRGTTPIAVEVLENAEPAYQFSWPESPLFVFGPEDGALPKAVRGQCHRFLFIPTAYCLNLASAVTAVLVLWRAQRAAAGLDPIGAPADYLAEHRGPVDNPDVFVGISPAGYGRHRR